MQSTADPAATLPAGPRSSVDRAAVSYTALSTQQRSSGTRTDDPSSPWRCALLGAPCRISNKQRHFSVHVRENIQYEVSLRPVANRSLGVLLPDALLGADKRGSALVLDVENRL
jgi:hypothetical protein